MGRILVTGSTGFIGQVVVKKLLARNESVVGFATSHGQNILNTKQIEDALQFCDRIIHLAAKVDFSNKNAEEVINVNANGTAFLLGVAAYFPIKKMVFVSSAIAMGIQKSPDVIMDESFFSTSSLDNNYLRAKMIAEYNCLTSQTPIVIVNPSTAKPISSMVAPPGGTNIIDVEDVADGIIAALDHGRPKERYLLTDKNITFKELYPWAIPLPRWSKGICKTLNKKNAFLIDNAFSYKYYTNEKARRELQWKPGKASARLTKNSTIL